MTLTHMLDDAPGTAGTGVRIERVWTGREARYLLHTPTFTHELSGADLFDLARKAETLRSEHRHFQVSHHYPALDPAGMGLVHHPGRVGSVELGDIGIVFIAPQTVGDGPFLRWEPADYNDPDADSVWVLCVPTDAENPSPAASTEVATARWNDPEGVQNLVDAVLDPPRAWTLFALAHGAQAERLAEQTRAVRDARQRAIHLQAAFQPLQERAAVPAHTIRTILRGTLTLAEQEAVSLWSVPMRVEAVLGDPAIAAAAGFTGTPESRLLLGDTSLNKADYPVAGWRVDTASLSGIDALPLITQVTAAVQRAGLLVQDHDGSVYILRDPQVFAAAFRPYRERSLDRGNQGARFDTRHVRVSKPGRRAG